MRGMRRVSQESAGSKASNFVSLSSLIAAPYNPRLIGKDALKRLSKSIKKFGDISGIVVNKQTGHLVSGHQRVKAILGEFGDVPIVDSKIVLPSGESFSVRVVEWDEETEKAANVTANNQLISGEFIKADLVGLLREIEGADCFSDVGLDALLASIGGHEAAKDDEEIEVAKESRAVVGDIWICGRHRIACGDSRDTDLVGRLLNGRKPFMMVTDPPYGIEYKPEWREACGLGVQRVAEIANDDIADWSDAFALAPADVAYVWHAAKKCIGAFSQLEACEYQVRAQIIWAKDNFPIGRGAYTWQHEPCWYAVRKGASARWCGDRSQSTVWRAGKDDEAQQTRHATQKPIDLFARPMRNHGDKGDLVYEPFLGSGTCLIAAEQTGRDCCAVEMDPMWVEAAIARWERIVGEKAVRG